MNVSLVHAIVIFWLGLLLWILAEYLVYRIQTALQNSEKYNREQKRIFWFTDTINDLNGVSITLKNIGWLSSKRGDDMYIVSSLLKDKIDDSLPPNYINLPPVIHFKMPCYKTLDANIPSIFRIMYLFLKYKPDEVFISTPSAVGTFALICAKLFGKHVTAIYHTDFTMQIHNILGRKSFVGSFVETYTKLFYKAVNKMLVPTQEYINILAKRGLKHKNTGIFYRGLDTNKFRPIPAARRSFHQNYDVPSGINLLYSGRISQDKNIEFLINSFKEVQRSGSTNQPINLIFAGDGPAFGEYSEKYGNDPSIFFLGYLPNHTLPEIYSSADLLVFPSETDTFGMAVLESLSCGVPALVSHIGGPSNIVNEGQTGYILNTNSSHVWTEKLKELVPMIENNDPFYTNLCISAREQVLKRYDFYRILDNYLGYDKEERKAEHSKSPSQITNAG